MQFKVFRKKTLLFYDNLDMKLIFLVRFCFYNFKINLATCHSVIDWILFDFSKNKKINLEMKLIFQALFCFYNFKIKLATCHSVIDWIDKVQSLFFMHFENIDHDAMLLQLGCIFNNRKCHFNLLVFSI